jgi:capsular polysaccharide biosynthesis protein
MAAAQLSNERNLDSSEIQSMITVTQSSDNIIRISAVSTDGTLAVDVTNSVATSFVQEITRITGYDSIQILDTASEYYLRMNGLRHLIKKRLLYAALGFVISCLFIVITDFSSKRVRTIMQCGNKEEIIGIIPFVAKLKE